MLYTVQSPPFPVSDAISLESLGRRHTWTISEGSTQHSGCSGREWE